MALVELLNEHLLSVLVRDVLDHQSSARVLSIHYLVQVQPEPLFFSTKSFILSHWLQLRPIASYHAVILDPVLLPRWLLRSFLFFSVRALWLGGATRYRWDNQFFLSLLLLLGLLYVRRTMSRKLRVLRRELGRKRRESLSILDKSGRWYIFLFDLFLRRGMHAAVFRLCTPGLSTPMRVVALA